MKAGFYSRLALDGIRKNRRMYGPYILSCIVMVMMTYIVVFIWASPVVASLNGGTTIQALMEIGIVIIIFFSAIFLFYTNAFLIKQRKKEFGLYNILGMGKASLAILLAWEVFYTAVASIGLGLFLGIALSKLAELGLVNMMGGTVDFSMDVSWAGIAVTASAYVCIFSCLYLADVFQIRKSTAVSLLKSENAGEKPPKVNWLLGVLGIALLCWAYWIASSIQNPLTALSIFMFAVLMVIAGTYLVMISGSVMICRILQKSKRYYYKASHFVSVSSMVYRMKRNGAGLASICILATMVLVMISSTLALLAGSESAIVNRYPREINMKFETEDNTFIGAQDKEQIEAAAAQVLAQPGSQPENVFSLEYATIAGLLKNDEVVFDSSTVDTSNIGVLEDVYQFYIIPLADFNAMTGQNKTLQDDEVLVYTDSLEYPSQTFGFAGGPVYRVKEVLSDFPENSSLTDSAVGSILVVASDPDAVTSVLKNAEGEDLFSINWQYSFDTGLSEEASIWAAEEIDRQIGNAGVDVIRTVESRDSQRQDFYSLYGGLFYLGLILSLVFVLAAVMIMYYKQISEGYEDQARFEIMQKVGMSHKEIRKCINSQMLIVFFLPLGLAGLHLVFAFPIIEKLLLLFHLNDSTLFKSTILASFLVFALLYVIVYRMTSNACYTIVCADMRQKA